MEVAVHNYITIEVTIRLTEIEARAMDALVGYGDDSFLKVFYDRMGKNYLQPYEQGLRSLFAKCRKSIGPALYQVYAARKKMDDESGI